VDIVYHKQAAKYIERMDAATKQRIKQGIAGIPNGDIKPMRQYSDGRQRLRISKYRVVFNYVTVDGETAIYIMDIDSRGDIYK